MPSTITDRLAGLTTSVAVKAPCVAATTANITLSGEQTIDGVAVVADDRVLVKNQSSAVDNGIYVVSTGSWTRAKDFDGARDAVEGTLVYIIDGTVNSDTHWRLDTADVTFGTTSIAFAQASVSTPTFIAQVQGAIQQSAYTYCGTAGGTANAITLTPSPAITSYVAGHRFQFKSASANNSSVTVAISGLTTKAITKNGTTALSGGEIPSGAVIDIMYDGTEFQLLDPVELLTASVSTAMLATIATKTILSNNSGSSASPAANTLTTVLDFIGSAAQGDILYRDSSAWARLGAGTAGQVLKSGGAAANPSWTNSSAYKIITTTYDVSTTGSLAMTGAGFTPRLVFVFAAVNGTKAWSVGTYDGSSNGTVASNAANTTETISISTAFCSGLLTATGSTQGLLAGASLDSDGVTFTKSKNGSPTGTGTLVVICFR